MSPSPGWRVDVEDTFELSMFEHPVVVGRVSGGKVVRGDRFTSDRGVAAAVSSIQLVRPLDTADFDPSRISFEPTGPGIEAGDVLRQIVDDRVS